MFYVFAALALLALFLGGSANARTGNAAGIIYSVAVAIFWGALAYWWRFG